MRQVLRWLHEAYDCPRLDHLIHKRPVPAPRNVTAQRAEIDALLAAAHPGLKVWLLLCSDLAIRSGTAARLGPEHYNPENQTLTFTTKKDAAITLPVTAELRELIEQCDSRSNVPFTNQLWPQQAVTTITGQSQRKALRRLANHLKITRRLTAHDFRRTTGVAVLEATGDIRTVQSILGHKSLQSTIWYLDHGLRPVRRSLLETIKRPAWAERKQA